MRNAEEKNGVSRGKNRMERSSRRRRNPTQKYRDFSMLEGNSMGKNIGRVRSEAEPFALPKEKRKNAVRHSNKDLFLSKKARTHQGKVGGEY